MRVTDNVASVGKLIPIRLNIMVVGETGSGKTTFLRTMFKHYTADEIIRAEMSAPTERTVEIQNIGKFIIPSSTVACQVNLFDSPGFGDYIDNNNAIHKVRDYLQDKHHSWLGSNANVVTHEVYLFLSVTSCHIVSNYFPWNAGKKCSR